MKRISFAAAVLLLLSLFVYKPVQAQEGVKIGFRASPLIGWANISDRDTKSKPDGLETSAALGFSFDFVFTYGFSESVGLRTGVNIAAKSFKSQTVIAAFDTDLTQSIGVTAVEIPLGLKFRSPEIGSGMYIVGHFGVNPELNVQNKIKTTGTILGLPVDEEQVDVDGISFFTASFVPGVGLDWEFDWGMLEFALTYHWGLLSITDPDNDDLGNLRTRMNYIALNLGYFF